MKKTFDCVEMKHKIQEELYNESHARNFNEYAEFIKEKAKHSILFSRIKSYVK